MTNQEAANLIRRAIAEIEWEQPMEYAAAFDKAIEALEGKDKDVPAKWVSVEEALPTEEGQDCWVWCKELGEPELDNWEGGRGEKAVASMGPNETREFIKSGWYYNDMQPITHWMPVDAPKVPEPPKEENDENHV